MEKSFGILRYPFDLSAGRLIHSYSYPNAKQHRGIILVLISDFLNQVFAKLEEVELVAEAPFEISIKERLF